MQRNDNPYPPAEPDPAQEEGIDVDFTSEEAENRWDGTQVELVADQDAADYEDDFTGLKIRYTLTEEDLYDCLKAANPFKTTGVRAIVQSAILALFGVLFCITYFIESPPVTSSLVFSGLCFLMIGVIWLVPHFALKSRAKKLYTGQPVTAEIFPDEIQIGEGEGAWKIALDGTSSYLELENLLVVRTPENRLAAFPIRSIEPAALPEIQAMLLSGALPETKKGRKK